MTTKTQTVQQYIAKSHAGDLDAAYAFVTDDFVYLYEGGPKPSELGFSDSGLNKAQYKDFHAQILEQHRDLTTNIDSIAEDGDKVHVKGLTKHTYDIPAAAGQSVQTVTAETVFNAEYTFSGDKICSVKAIAQPDAK